MDQYQYKVDRVTGIINDPNDYSAESNNPRYILDLLLSVISLSVKTVKIVKTLPKIDFNLLQKDDGL